LKRLDNPEDGRQLIMFVIASPASGKVAVSQALIFFALDQYNVSRIRQPRVRPLPHLQTSIHTPELSQAGRNRLNFFWRPVTIICLIDNRRYRRNKDKIKPIEIIPPVLNLIASSRLLIIGHRGNCSLAPENTVPSFQLALAAGADLIELDYHHSQDGVPMVIHDATLDRTTNAREVWKRKRIRVADKTAVEIQTLDAGGWFDKKFAGAKVPLLVEALNFVCGGGGVPLIEHKSGNAETLAKLLRERKLINCVVVISFDWKFLHEFHELEPGQILGALGPPAKLVNGRKPVWISKHLNEKWLKALGNTGAKIVIWNRNVKKKAIHITHQHNLKTWIYTVDQAPVVRRLLAMGCDGIITNSIARCQK
jgi:glycerophosphoryl diester phosphodiesterase